MNLNDHNQQSNLLTTIKKDFFPSIAVFLVALPLCMGIAIASGVPVAAGLITGIVGGLVVGLLSGAPLQVSGPAAGLTVVVYGIVQEFGLETFGLIVLMGGLIQVVAGLLRLGQWFRAVSPAVIKGMLAGIGLLILGSQFHVMIDDAPKESGIENLLTIPQAIAKGIGFPEASSPEVREARTELLKEIGILHQRQRELERSLADAAQRAPAEPVAPEHSDLIAEPTSRREEWIDAQSSIHEQLRAAAEQITTLAASYKPLARAERAAEVALGNSELVLTQLQTEAFGPEVRESQAAASRSLSALLAQLKDHQWAAKIGILTIVVLLLWQTFAGGRLRMIPAPLVAVSVATIVAFAGSLPVIYVEVPDNLLNTINLPSFSVLQSNSLWPMLQAAIVIALIASAETLLCATAVDQIHGKQRTDYDRELWAQGIGNTICGYLGALPMTGVIVRSAANVQAGATSRFSAVMHGAWLLTFVSFLAFALRAIPVASLAAVLVYTGYKLLNLKQLKELRKYGWGEVAIFMATFIMIVVTDLLTGVIVGIVLAAAKLLFTFSHLRTDLQFEKPDNRARLSLEGTATFLRLPILASALERVPANAELHVDLQRLQYVDHACLELMMNWAKQHESTGGTLVMDWNSLTAQFHPDVLPPEKQPKTHSPRLARHNGAVMVGASEEEAVTP